MARITKRHKKSKSLQIVQKFFPKVTSVRDGGRDLEIEVTPQDVKSSRAKDHNGCAMAVACARAEKADGMVVSITTAYVVKGKQATRYHVPQSVSREITAFDRGAAFEPGTYTLKQPGSYMALGSPKHLVGENDSTSTGATRETHARHLTGGIRTVLSGHGKRRRG